MPKTQDVSHEEWVSSCRSQLIEEKLMIQEDDGRYILTPQGIEKVRKEFQRYQMRPAMMVMIEQYILQEHEITVY